MTRLFGFCVASVKLSIPAAVLAVFVGDVWPFGVALAVAALLAVVGDP